MSGVFGYVAIAIKMEDILIKIMQRNNCQDEEFMHSMSVNIIFINYLLLSNSSRLQIP